MGSPAEVLEALQEASSIVITSQSPLDGDSVGCEVALLHLAPRMFPGTAVRVLNESPPPDLYAFLAGIERLGVQEQDGETPEADTLVVLDCGDLDRFSYLPGLFPRARIINIDHHASNPGFGHVSWVAPDRASTAEQILQLLEMAKVPLSVAAANALYVAMVFDTGRFAYSNTRPRTHIFAARLLEVGVRPEEMYREIYRNRSLAALKMMGYAIETMNLAAKGKLAWVKITAAAMKTAGAGPEDLEDLVNLPMTLGGIEVSVLFKETQDGRIKVSLRSDRWFDVAEFARHHGGGGHVRASGLTLQATMDQAEETIINHLVKELEKRSG